MESRFTPGGFFNASKAAKVIRELVFNKDADTSGGVEGLLNTVTRKDWVDPEPNYDYSEPSTLIYYNAQNQIADKEIGVFANHNITHAYLTIFKRVELKNSLALGQYAKGGLKDLVQRNNPRMRAYSELMIAELLAASVDAVKDPVLNYLNIN